MRSLWSQSLTRAHGRHEVANLAGPLILAHSLKAAGDRGADQLVQNLESDPAIRAFASLLQTLRLLPEDSKRPGSPPDIVPLADSARQLAADSLLQELDHVRFLLVDDQAPLGYAQLLSVILTGDPGPAWNDAGQGAGQRWSREKGAFRIEACLRPDLLLDLLESASSEAEWRKLKVFGRDHFDVLLLDLRLIPQSGLDVLAEEERTFLGRLIAVYRAVNKFPTRKGEPPPITNYWTTRAFEAARDRSERKTPERPLQWALLPLLLSETDPSLPIVIFSSTHQWAIAEALRSAPNVVTSFAKPLMSGYREADPSETRADLIEALEQALHLHEKRAIWKHFATLKPWPEPPVFEVAHGNKRYAYGDEKTLRGALTEKERNTREFKGRHDQLTTEGLSFRLGWHYREQLMLDRYHDCLSVPYELLEEVVTPSLYLTDFLYDRVELHFEPLLDPDYNPMGRALQLIRHKKSHGWAGSPTNSAWKNWEENGAFAAAILLFLGDFIARRKPDPGEPLPTDALGWEKLALKMAWRLADCSAPLRTFLGLQWRADQKSDQALHPSLLIPDMTTDWRDVAAYTLALAFATMPAAYTDPLPSARLLAKLISRTEKVPLAFGTLEWSKQSDSSRTLIEPNDSTTSGSGFFCEPKSVLPNHGPTLPGLELVVFARNAADRINHPTVLRIVCLPPGLSEGQVKKAMAQRTQR